MLGKASLLSQSFDFPGLVKVMRGTGVPADYTPHCRCMSDKACGLYGTLYTGEGKYRHYFFSVSIKKYKAFKKI